MKWVDVPVTIGQRGTGSSVEDYLDPSASPARSHHTGGETPHGALLYGRDTRVQWERALRGWLFSDSDAGASGCSGGQTRFYYKGKKKQDWLLGLTRGWIFSLTSPPPSGQRLPLWQMDHLFNACEGVFIAIFCTFSNGTMGICQNPFSLLPTLFPPTENVFFSDPKHAIIFSDQAKLIRCTRVSPMWRLTADSNTWMYLQFQNAFSFFSYLYLARSICSSLHLKDNSILFFFFFFCLLD